jgi:hypothetical protein
MATTSYFVPALDLLPYWPHDLIAPADVPLLGALTQFVGVTDFEVVEYDGYLTLVGVMAVWEELELDLPLVDGLTLVLGEVGGGITEIPFELRLGQAVEPEDLTSAEGAFNLFLKGYLPPYELVLPEFDVKLRVSRRYLKPMTPNDSAHPELGFTEKQDGYVELQARGEMVVNTETGVHVEGLSAVDLDYAQIRSTGVVIRAENVVIRLSSAQPLPDIEDPDFDLPPDWTGLYFAQLNAFNLQEAWEHLPPVVELTNWYLGTGGVSGKIAAVFDLQPNMDNQSFALRTLQLALQQGTIVQALVQVAVKLEFWDDRVFYLDVAITNDPLLDYPASLGFHGSVSAEQPPSAPLPTEDELLALALSSGTTVIAQLRVTKLGVRSLPDRKRAEKENLPVDTRFFDILVDGHFSVLPTSNVGDGPFGAGVTDVGMQLSPSLGFIMPGGLWVNVSEKVVSKLSGFPISFSRVGFGAEDDEKWIGLDARLAFGGSTKFGAAVKGLRIYFGGAAGLHLAFEGIELALSSLPTFSVAGFLSMTSGSDPGGMADSDVTFQGGTQILIGPLGLDIGGFILFGRKGGERFWYVSLDGTFDPGIPISTTGFALLGGTILLGNNIAPNRLLSGDQGDDFNWYEHWYKPSPGPFNVIHSGKWQPAIDENAFGIGATFGNMSSGRQWSLKALLIILRPGPTLILEGRLTLLRKPESHKGAPKSNVRALAVWDKDDASFLLAFEIDYKLPDSGLLVDLHAEGEIFYRGGWPPDDWYIALGWYEPISRRIRASLIRLFSADTYFIVSGHELTIAERDFSPIAVAFGFRTGFDKRWKLGPVRAVAAAWFSIDVAMSTDPKYILGQVALHGELSVKVYGLGFELLLDARLAMEAPVNDDDLFFAGIVELRIGLPWPLPDVKKDLPIKFGDTSALPPPVDPLVDSASVTPGYPSSGEPIFRRGEPLEPGPTLPLDGRVALNFRRPMRSNWSGAPTPSSVAAPDQVGDVFYRYTVTDVRVRVERSDGTIGDLEEELFGNWALGVGDQSGPNADSLILWGLTPFPYAGMLGWPTRTVRRSWADLLIRYYDGYPCRDDVPPERCVDFAPLQPGTYEPELHYQPDPRLAPLAFTPFPVGEVLQQLQVGWAETVHLPLRIVDAVGQDSVDSSRCLQLARTTFIGSIEDSNVTIVRQSQTIWGVAIDLPSSIRITGEVEYSLAHYQLRVRALSKGSVVRVDLLNTHEFEIAVTAPMSVDRVELLLEPAPHAPAGVAGPPPCLHAFCYTSLGLVDALLEAETARGHWTRLFDVITVSDNGDPDETPGAGLIHEQGTTYHIEVDVQTESADSIDGPWTDRGTNTEQFSVPVGAAPADLSPYVADITPSDGQQPVYADYDMRVTYNRFYVETMYRKTGDPLHAQLLDAMGRLVEPVAEPASKAEPGLTAELELFADLLADADCVPFDSSLVPGNDETTYVTRLATSTAYEIRLFGGGHTEPVYRWAFTTSRYRNFAEHAADLRSAPWNEALPDAADFSGLGTRLAAASIAVRDAEFDLFLAAWTQDLGLPLRTLPGRPEVSLLWEVTDTIADVRAIALVSPEPMMGERTSVRLLRRGSGGVTTEQLIGRLRSRDGTRMLLASLDAAGAPIPLPPGEYILGFTFRLTGPGLREISRGGSLADETASWSFTVPDEPDKIIDPEA